MVPVQRFDHVVGAAAGEEAARDERHLWVAKDSSRMKEDATPRRTRGEEELRFKNTLLTTVQEASIDGILVVDQGGKFMAHNQRFVRMWGIPDDIMETRRDDLALKFVRDQLVEPEAFAARVRYLYDHPTETSSDEIHLKDGRVLDRYSAPVIGPDQEHYGRVWYFRDVTERIEAERSIRESEERLGRILASAMDAIVTIDAKRTVTLFNHAAETVFGAPADEVIGSPFDRFLSREFRRVLSDCMGASAAGGAPKRHLWSPSGLTARRSSGESFPVEATISEADVAGRKLYTIILRDVDERKRAEAELRRLQVENLYLREEARTDFEVGEIVGASPEIQRVMEQVKHVAETDSTVLITGETGTGKELIARAIHDSSRRRDKILVTVNCAALPTGLIESELFGHEKGAFTGALARKIGRFELADGGTIFLDEVGDIPLELQAKLLRVLQEGEFERVGGDGPIPVDTRVVAATNKDLEQEVAAGRVRADLYYRLHVFPLPLPPLRERDGDVPLLVRYFAAKFARRMGKHIEMIEPETMRRLTAYPWPGNVRELENMIERMVILSAGPVLELEEAALPGAPPPPESANQPSPAPEDPAEAGDLPEHEPDRLVVALERAGWNQSKAARLLGIGRTTLWRKIKQYGIALPRGNGT
jgi:PAS domain S-box-containing protein